MKTVLAPNAPWPTYAMSETLKSLKQASKPVKRVRSKPSDTDARFKQWMEKINGS